MYTIKKVCGKDELRKTVVEAVLAYRQNNHTSASVDYVEVLEQSERYYIVTVHFCPNEEAKQKLYILKGTGERELSKKFSKLAMKMLKKRMMSLKSLNVVREAGVWFVVFQS